MTALWEAKLNDIAHKNLNYNAFMTSLVENLEVLMNQARDTPLSRFSALENGPKRRVLRNVEPPKRKDRHYVEISRKRTDRVVRALDSYC